MSSSIFVYVVTAGDYSDYHIERIFSSWKAAARFCALTNKYLRSHYDRCSVEKFAREGELPPHTITVTAYARYDNNGVTTDDLFRSIEWGATATPLRPKILADNRGPEFGYIQVLGTDEAAVRKALTDRLVQRLSEPPPPPSPPLGSGATIDLDEED